MKQVTKINILLALCFLMCVPTLNSAMVEHRPLSLGQFNVGGVKIDPGFL